MTFEDWLTKEGYTPMESHVDGIVQWKKVSKYGATRCLETRHTPIIILTQSDDDTFVMSVRGKATRYYPDISATEIKKEDLPRWGRGIEHRLIGAWQELAS